MTDLYMMPVLVACLIPFGAVVLFIVFGAILLMDYMENKCAASIRRYRDKVSRRRADRDEINRPDPKPEDSAPEKHEPHLNGPLFIYGANPFGLGFYLRSCCERRDYEWFYLGGKQDD